MMAHSKILITLVESRGPFGQNGCHHRHKVGQHWDFDTQRGELCPMAMHVGFIYADILRYGGKVPGNPPGTASFSCPDPKVLNIFKLEIVEGIDCKRVPAEIVKTDRTVD